MPVGGIVPATKRGTEILRKVVPRTTAKNAKRAISGCPRGTVCRRTGVIAVPTILAPFADIAVHVVELKGIGWIGADWRRAIPVSIEVGVCGPELIAEGVARRGSCSARIFPFRFGQEPVSPTG